MLNAIKTYGPKSWTHRAGDREATEYGLEALRYGRRFVTGVSVTSKGVTVFFDSERTILASLTFARDEEATLRAELPDPALWVTFEDGQLFKVQA